jgi:hypothetical protein
MTYPSYILEEANHPWALELSSASHIGNKEKQTETLAWLNQKLCNYARDPCMHRDQIERSMRRIIPRMTGFSCLSLVDAIKEVLKYGPEPANERIAKLSIRTA